MHFILHKCTQAYKKYDNRLLCSRYVTKSAGTYFSYTQWPPSRWSTSSKPLTVKSAPELWEEGSELLSSAGIWGNSAFSEEPPQQSVSTVYRHCPFLSSFPKLTGSSFEEPFFTYGFFFFLYGYLSPNVEANLDKVRVASLPLARFPTALGLCISRYL